MINCNLALMIRGGFFMYLLVYDQVLPVPVFSDAAGSA